MPSNVASFISDMVNDVTAGCLYGFLHYPHRIKAKIHENTLSNCFVFFFSFLLACSQQLTGD